MTPAAGVAPVNEGDSAVNGTQFARSYLAEAMEIIQSVPTSDVERVASGLARVRGRGDACSSSESGAQPVMPAMQSTTSARSVASRHTRRLTTCRNLRLGPMTTVGKRPSHPGWRDPGSGPTMGSLCFQSVVGTKRPTSRSIWSELSSMRRRWELQSSESLDATVGTLPRSPTPAS